MEHQHARPRQQRGVEFERRIFGGGADQHHGAVFHHRQERILLGAVEAMHLVDEQQRALAGLAPGARGVERLLQVGDAGKHRRDLLEMQFGGVRQQPRHRGLAGTRRAPEDQRAQRARRQHPRQRAVGSEDMILPDHVRQRARAQPVRQRMRRILLHPRGGEQVCGFAWSLRAHPPSVTLICWPPRTSVMRQTRADSPRRLFEIAGLGDLLVVDREDDVALLEPDTCGGPAVGQIGHHDAFGVGIEMQFVGHRRRDVRDLRALERRAPGQYDSLRPMSGAWNAVFEAGKQVGIKNIGLGARDTLRLEMGYCLYGNDINDTTSPIEAGLGWITKFTPEKDFINKAGLLRQKQEGVSKKLVGFKMVDMGIPRHGYPIVDASGKVIGEVTSGTMAPSLKIPVGMGYVPTSLSKEGSEIFINIRGKALKAVVVKLPFYKG